MLRCEEQACCMASLAERLCESVALWLCCAISFLPLSCRYKSSSPREWEDDSAATSPESRGGGWPPYCGLVARMSGDGPGASTLRTLLKPTPSSQFLISLKLKVSPRSVLTSICTANISECVGSVRRSFTSHSAIALVPP